MSGSRRGSLKQKSERFDSNINKRGNVKLCMCLTVRPLAHATMQCNAHSSLPCTLHNNPAFPPQRTLALHRACAARPLCPANLPLIVCTRRRTAPRFVRPGPRTMYHFTLPYLLQISISLEEYLFLTCIADGRPV